MLISVINRTHGALSDAEIQRVLRAVNRQVGYDFQPHWHRAAELRLEGGTGGYRENAMPSDMRGEGILYLMSRVSVRDALGYHDRNYRGIPCGFVFTELAKKLDEPWSATFSHEVLELIGDPEVNLLVRGPHPTDRRRQVFHWHEMCDAVQDEHYLIDGVTVSNFVLPLYFTSTDERGGRNDFLGTKHHGKSLSSFGVNPGGYIGYFDPRNGEHSTYAIAGDTRAATRKAIKLKAKRARRAVRYQAK